MTSYIAFVLKADRRTACDTMFETERSDINEENVAGCVIDILLRGFFNANNINLPKFHIIMVSKFKPS